MNGTTAGTGTGPGTDTDTDTEIITTDGRNGR